MQAAPNRNCSYLFFAITWSKWNNIAITAPSSFTLYVYYTYKYTCTNIIPTLSTLPACLLVCFYYQCISPSCPLTAAAASTAADCACIYISCIYHADSSLSLLYAIAMYFTRARYIHYYYTNTHVILIHFYPPPYSSLNFIFSHRKLDYNTNVLYLFPLPELIQQQQQWKPFVVKIDEQFTNIL